jgi:hypothetical protein
MLVVLAQGLALGCASVEAVSIPSPDAGSSIATGGTSPNGTYRCDGERAQQLDVLTGRWNDTGDCAIKEGSGSVLHWSGGAWTKGSAVLPGEGMTDRHRIVAGASNDVWWLSWRQDILNDHAMLFHWDGAWWTQLYDFEKFLPSGVVRDAAGGVWVYGQRQVFSGLGIYQLVPSVLHVAPTRDRWDEVWLLGSTDPEKGPGGLLVDMQATSDGTIWAVGRRPITGDGVVMRMMTVPRDGVVMRGMGSAWEETPYFGAVPSSIWAQSATDAWMTTSGVGVFHWDGVAWTNTWRVRTSPGRLAGYGWLTNGYHWDGTSWSAPDASFPGGFDVAYVRPHVVGVGRPYPPEQLGLFALGDPASLTTHTELWAYDGTRWTKETSALAAGIEAAGGVLTAVAGDSANLWIAPIWPYSP